MNSEHEAAQFDTEATLRQTAELVPLDLTQPQLPQQVETRRCTCNVMEAVLCDVCRADRLADQELAAELSEGDRAMDFLDATLEDQVRAVLQLAPGTELTDRDWKKFAVHQLLEQVESLGNKFRNVLPRTTEITLAEKGLRDCSFWLAHELGTL